MESPYAVARIKNITPEHPLTDELVAEAKNLFPAALRGMITYVVMNGVVKPGAAKNADLLLRPAAAETQA